MAGSGTGENCNTRVLFAWSSASPNVPELALANCEKSKFVDPVRSIRPPGVSGEVGPESCVVPVPRAIDEAVARDFV